MYKGTNLCTRDPHPAFLAITCMRGCVFKQKTIRNTQTYKTGIKCSRLSRLEHLPMVALTETCVQTKTAPPAAHVCPYSTVQSICMLQQRPPSLHAQRTARKRTGWLHTHNPPRNKASIHLRMHRSTRAEGELPLLLPHLLRFLSPYVALILHRPYCSEFCKKSRSITSESKTHPFLGGQRKTPANSAEGALLQYSEQSRV